MEELQKTMDNLWGEVLADHVVTRRLTLTVEVNDPRWASQLAFIRETLLGTCSAHGLPITDIDIKVRRVMN
jgi:hypothetical protein